MGKGSTKYQLLKDDFDHAVKQIELRNKEIELLRAGRESSIHECRQLFNERMKFKEEIEFLKDDVQVRDEQIERLEKELYELKNDINQEDMERVVVILDRSEDLCEEHANDKEWLMDKFKNRYFAERMYCNE